MTIGEFSTNATKLLVGSGVSTAKLDIDLLLSDILDKDRGWVIAHPEHVLTDMQVKQLEQLVTRRSQHEPIAYIRGFQEFYGRTFVVSPDTLTPRSETETMIELLLQEMNTRNATEPLQIIDVGTGSGCIIITVALELQNNPASHPPSLISYTGLDISKPALKIARQNAEANQSDVEFQQFDLLQDNLSTLRTHGSELVVMANLPYVPADFTINTAATHEPEFAIYGGSDGLLYYKALFDQLKNTRAKAVYTEALPPQHKGLCAIAKSCGYTLSVEQDFVQVFTAE